VFGVLTTENEIQALARLGGHHGNKAHDAIDTACAMVATLSQLGG
jgi:6,7-dimethyl-8-ribityllumazine synthase